MSDFSTTVFSPAHSFAKPQLVEASAGTGKTYNIQNVFLRLILEQGLTVRQILVVTFTNAATLELRERLRNVLLHCRYFLEAPPAPNTELSPEQQRIQSALQLVPHEKPAVLKQRVQLALMDFDSAAIFTIHGFCKRVLDRYAFECGHDPDAELMPEASLIIREVCQDWWRKNTYSPSTATATATAATPPPFDNIGTLLDFVRAACSHPSALIHGSALPDSPAVLDAVAACSDIFQALGGYMKGNFIWQPDGLITRAKQNTAGIAPLRQSIQANQAEWDAWLKEQNAAPGPRHELAEAFLYLLNTLAATPDTGDAKEFAQKLKLVADTAGQNLALAPRARVIDQLRRDIQLRIRDRAALTYDAMLTNVRDVLHNPGTGPRLHTVLRDEFRAALIDEFQDTDPVQYDIFWNLFSEGGIPLVFVGDPKQAIYGFRGGDIFTYYSAKEKIAAPNQQHSLDTNYRSEKALVAAINDLFADHPADPTFQNEHIPYLGNLKAHGVTPSKQLLVNGAPDTQPFHIWTLAPGDPDWPALVARETVRLLTDPATTINGDPVQPQHIAILVKTHDEAAAMQAALNQMGVNAVRQARDNIFDSADAPNLILLMHAMLEPGQGRRIRNALATGLLPCSLDTLQAYNTANSDSTAPAPADPTPPPPPAGAPRLFEEWSDIFRAAGQRWNQFSFIEGIQFLLAQLNVYPHLAQSPGGADRIANLRHLVEIIHQTARAKKLGPVALTHWLNRQLHAAHRDSAASDDDSTARATDDSPAVQIMTLFKSKGLQFPIVFAPTLCDLKNVPKHKSASTLLYHQNNQLILDIDTKSGVTKSLAQAENHQENIRKIYVALTRAINRVILFESEDKRQKSEYPLSQLLDRLSADPAQILRQPVPPNLPSTPWHGTPQPRPADLAPRTLAHPVDKSHGHASFSSLMPHRAATPAADAPAAPLSPPPDAPLRDIDQQTDSDPSPPDADTDAGTPPIFAIPGGAKIGNCWHDIFEHIDFQDITRNPAAITQITNQTLDRYHILPAPPPAATAAQHQLVAERRAAVHSMVAHTLTTPLQPLGNTPAFALQDIPMPHRRSELEFNFSLQDAAPHTLRGIGDILDQHWHTPARNPAFIARLQQSQAALPLGFMTGFIDLVFHHDERFYIVDWKSNRLNGRPDGFHPAALADEMSANAYYLQYLIYSVALHGFLSTRLAGYSFAQHTGGIFYLFLRGMDGATRSGIFHDQPSHDLIQALARYLGGTP